MGAFTRCMSKTQQTKKPAECGVKTLKEAPHKSTGNATRTSLLRALKIDRAPKPPTEGSVSRNSQDSARAPQQGDHCGAVTCLVPMSPPRPCRSLKPLTLGQSGNQQPGGHCKQQRVCVPQSPFPEKRHHFSYLAAPGEASSQPETGCGPGSQPEAGRGPVPHIPRPALCQPRAQGRRGGEGRR